MGWIVLTQDKSGLWEATPKTYDEKKALAVYRKVTEDAPQLAVMLVEVKRSTHLVLISGRHKG